MAKFVFFLSFVMIGGELVHVMVPVAPKHQRDFSNITAPANPRAAIAAHRA